MPPEVPDGGVTGSLGTVTVGGSEDEPLGLGAAVGAVGAEPVGAEPLGICSAAGAGTLEIVVPTAPGRPTGGADHQGAPLGAERLIGALVDCTGAKMADTREPRTADAG